MFLAVKNVYNNLFNLSCVHAKTGLKEQIVNVIQEFPDFRDVSNYCNTEEALQMLQVRNLIWCTYELIQDQLCKSREEERNQVSNAFLALAIDSLSLIIYTSTPVNLVVGIISVAFLTIDTHCIIADLGGKGNTIIKVVHCNGKIENGGQTVLDWLEKRMISSVGLERGPDSTLRLSLKETAIREAEMSCFSDYDDELLLSLIEDFKGLTEQSTKVICW